MDPKNTGFETTKQEMYFGNRNKEIGGLDEITKNLTTFITLETETRKTVENFKAKAIQL